MKKVSRNMKINGETGAMKKPFWVLENVGAAGYRRLFTGWGVEWLATRHAWLSVLIYGAAGLAVEVLLRKQSLAPGWWRTGLLYGLLLYSANVVHTLGHILSGHLVGQPMQANLLTTTFDVNLYTEDQTGYSRRVHIGRAVSGPLLNLAAGLVSLAIWRWTGRTWLAIAGWTHLASGLGTLLPIAPLDGWFIWQHTLHRRRAGR